MAFSDADYLTRRRVPDAHYLRHNAHSVRRTRNRRQPAHGAALDPGMPREDAGAEGGQRPSGGGGGNGTGTAFSRAKKLSGSARRPLPTLSRHLHRTSATIFLASVCWPITARACNVIIAALKLPVFSKPKQARRAARRSLAYGYEEKNQKTFILRLSQ
jgi:hypothetical protein